jgi:hypothetical protein
MNFSDMDANRGIETISIRILKYRERPCRRMKISAMFIKATKKIQAKTA